VTLLAQLVAAGITPTLARLFADPLEIAFERFGIDTPARRAAFVAQASHESSGFARLEENLYYRQPERIRQIFPSRVGSLQQAATLCRNPQGLANVVYAGKNGNGDAASGDGWRFRGRGLFQLTGRANYLAAGAALDRPYLETPDVVALPPDAALSAGWYWSSADCNALADSWQIDLITKRINGPAMLARVERHSAADEAMRAFA
jgi:putative chitinase